jgi:hypothetical protein
MKAGKLHRVPLSDRALAIVRDANRDGGEYVFGGDRPLSPLRFARLLRKMGTAT